MTRLTIETWLTFEEIEWINRWLSDLENWNIYEENEFYSNLEKRLFLKNKSYVYTKLTL